MGAQNYPRAGANVDGVALLTLTAASASVAGDDKLNNYNRGIQIVVDVTAISGTSPTLVITVEGKDPISGKYYTLLASASLTAVGTTVLTVNPGAVVTANVSANAALPRSYRVRATIGGTTPSVTATVAGALLV